MSATTKKTTANATAGIEAGLGAENYEAFLKAGSDSAKKIEDAIAFSKESIEIYLKAGTDYAKGLQDVSKQVLALAQKSVEESVNAGKALTQAKTLKEVVDMQASFAKSSFENLVAESNKLTQTSVKLTEQAIAPVSDRINLAVEKFLKPLAA